MKQLCQGLNNGFDKMFFSLISIASAGAVTNPTNPATACSGYPCYTKVKTSPSLSSHPVQYRVFKYPIKSCSVIPKSFIAWDVMPPLTSPAELKGLSCSIFQAVFLHNCGPG
jgi:hypothetical protein